MYHLGNSFFCRLRSILAGKLRLVLCKTGSQMRTRSKETKMAKKYVS